MTARGLSRLLPSLVVFAALLAAWQAAGPLFGVREYLLPGPLAVAQALGNFSIPWQTHLRVTTLEILGGFALAGAGGVALGIRSEEHTSDSSHQIISYAVFCLKKKKYHQ